LCRCSCFVLLFPLCWGKFLFPVLAACATVHENVVREIGQHDHADHVDHVYMEAGLGVMRCDEGYPTGWYRWDKRADMCSIRMIRLSVHGAELKRKEM
jgi:hypothetical protein